MVARKYFKIGVGSAIGITTIVGLFLLLVNNYGMIITGTDDSCRGTYEDACISLITIRNPTLFNVDVYNPNEIKLQFNPSIPEYYLFRKDGRCRGGASCAAPNGVSLSGWNYIDFTNKTKPVATAAYVYRFPARETKEFLLWGLKNKPNERVKWSLTAGGTELDPVWEATDIVSLENKNTNISYSEIRNITKWTTNCGVYYEVNTSYSGCYEKIGEKNVTYKVEVINEWQEVIINEKRINVTDFNLWCYEDAIIYCKSTFDCDGQSKRPGIKKGCSYCTINKTSGETDCFDHYKENLDLNLKKKIDENNK